jgi:protein TonB
MPAGSFPERRSVPMLRWSVAALAALALHGGLAWLAVNMPVNEAEASAGAPETAIIVELAALAPVPEAPATPFPPVPAPGETVPDERAEPEADNREAKSVSHREAAVEPHARPQQPAGLDIPLPELPAMPSADAMLPAPDTPAPETPAPRILPPQRPEVTAPKPPKPRIVRRKPEDKPQRTRQAASPPPAARASTAPMQDAQGRAAQPSVSAASWRSSLLAHLNRYKHFPEGARPGVVQVAFAIDGQGRVLSARLAASSGDATLDAEAVAMIRRASPVPAPPSGLPGQAINLAVPIRYAR